MSLLVARGALSHACSLNRNLRGRSVTKQILSDNVGSTGCGPPMWACGVELISSEAKRTMWKRYSLILKAKTIR